jgi:8-oxo-dGTP pyrophosphatase MutT (NUDIX family)
VAAWFEELGERIGSRPVLRLSEPEGLRPAAVLVPLQLEAGALWVVLIRRSDTMSQHAGQLAFPGGGREEGDEDEVATALREAHEEVGLAPDTVMVLGYLDEVVTSSGFAVAPVVGAVPAGAELTPHAGEVEAVVRMPLLYLANPALVEEQVLEIGGRRVRSPIFHYRSHRIWGATARILADLLSRLGLLG